MLLTKRLILGLSVLSTWWTAACCAADRHTADETNQRPCIVNSMGIKLAQIPAGEFVMGSPASDLDARPNERPAHGVRISKPFYLGVHEVTVGQFRRFVQETGYKTAAETDDTGTSGYNAETRGFEYDSPKYSWHQVGWQQTDTHPVVNVSWRDANTFCEWLGRKEDRCYRLPTEAEWEYACRAGTTTRFVGGDAWEDLRPLANVGDKSLARNWDTATVLKYGSDPKKVRFASWDDGFAFTAPVGSFQANPFGLHDMHGNVAEFCADWFANDYYQNSMHVDPSGPPQGEGNVCRGGAFLHEPKIARSAFRFECPTNYRNYIIGFRVLLDEAPP